MLYCSNIYRFKFLIYNIRWGLGLGFFSPYYQLLLIVLHFSKLLGFRNKLWLLAHPGVMPNSAFSFHLTVIF